MSESQADFSTQMMAECRDRERIERAYKTAGAAIIVIVLSTPDDKLPPAVLAAKQELQKVIGENK